MSNPTTTSQVNESQPQTEGSRLPPELMLLVIQLLSREDQWAFSLLSKLARQLALPILLRKISYIRNVPYHIERLNKAGSGVKAAIKFVQPKFRLSTH